MTSTTVKICFLMDCTASMSPWIREAKTKMAQIKDTVTREHPNAHIEMAFIGYRDYGDDDSIVVHSFTAPHKIMECIRKVRAEGGDDEAEDVVNGLEHAVHLDWSDADVRSVFHIADAPAHGMDFHGPSVSDRFPRGDPNGLDPRDFVERMSFLDIQYTFVKSTDTTDKMIDEFHKCYTKGGSFTVIDLRPQDGYDRSREFSRAVTRSVVDSIRQHTSSQAQ